MGLFGSQRGLGALSQAGPSDHQVLKIDGLGSCLAQVRTKQPLYI